MEMIELGCQASTEVTHLVPAIQITLFLARVYLAVELGRLERGNVRLS